MNNDSILAYLNYCKASGMADTTVSNHRRALNGFAQALPSGTTIETAMPLHIGGYKSALHNKGLKQSSIRCYLESIHLFYEWLVEMKAIESNPCSKSIAKTKVPPPPPYQHLLDKEDIAKLLNPKCPSNSFKRVWERTYAIVVLLITSGIRNSELRELKIMDLDAENNRLLVEFGKGGKTRYAPYPKIAQDAVANYMKSQLFPSNLSCESFLFGKGDSISNWKSFDRSELSRSVKRYVEAVTGKQEIRTHALRHSSASFLWDAGMSTDSIQEILGHSNVATTQRYLDRLRPDVPTAQANNLFDSFASAV